MAYRVPSRIHGHGLLLMVGHGETRRLLYDGAGLCSPGLWAPQDRYPATGVALLLQSALEDELSRWDRSVKGGLNIIYNDFAAGRIEDDPFPPAATERLREMLARASTGH